MAETDEEQAAAPAFASQAPPAPLAELMERAAPVLTAAPQSLEGVRLLVTARAKQGRADAAAAFFARLEDRVRLRREDVG